VRDQQEQLAQAQARIGHGFQAAEDAFLLHRLPALKCSLQQGIT
jgi:adenosine deaminase